jgi:uncharacterized Zn finger protein|tara:strand:+ start:664 stop:1065 length:402 start_codon:yes stop_codon:yes gene_type:complete
MGVIESTNSNPNTKGESSDVLIRKLYLHYNMKYEGNNSQNRIEKGFEIFLNNQVHLFSDNPLHARVEGSNGHEYKVVLSRNTCTCPDKQHNLSAEEKCKHIRAAEIARDEQLELLPKEVIASIAERRKREVAA